MVGKSKRLFSTSFCPFLWQAGSSTGKLKLYLTKIKFQMRQQYNLSRMDYQMDKALFH